MASPASHQRHYQASQTGHCKEHLGEQSTNSTNARMVAWYLGTTEELVKPKCIFRRIHALLLLLVFQSK